jgi:hypothetical protein
MRRIAVLAAMVFGSACGGSSSTQTFGATLSQANEPQINHLVTSNATGTASVQIVGRTLTYSLRANGLTVPAVAAHIHLKPTDLTTNGKVIVTFKNTAGATTNSVSVDDSAPTAPLAAVPDPAATNLDGSPMTFDQLVDHIQKGETYVNIHTGSVASKTGNPSGEIRGDLK